MQTAQRKVTAVLQKTAVPKRVARRVIEIIRC
jgi:hypothetical protein